MENNINLDAHSSLIIADGSIVEINGQKVLLTLVKDADAPEPKVIDLHKDSWAVLNDGSRRFKDTVVKWINENANKNWDGTLIREYYGLDTNKEAAMWMSHEYFTHILTLDEFCALAYPETSEAGSELVGKWFRCFDGYKPIFTTNKWYQCVKPIHESEAFSTNHEGEHDGFQEDNHNRFDLSNPLDYNPETLIGKYIGEAQIESIYYPNDKPCFHMNKGAKDVYCDAITPSDVTYTPPLPSLKYADCFERVKPTLYLGADLSFHDYSHIRQDAVKTERQAKQLAATIKLMTIAYDANGDWIPSNVDVIYVPLWDRESNELAVCKWGDLIGVSIYFKDVETAQCAYEANKEIFHDYFGVGGENE